jgi:hypothetical protein
MELCCLQMGAKASFVQASQDVERLTGVKISAKSVERIVARNPIAADGPEDEVSEMALDGGMVRLVSPPGEPSE